MLLVFSYIKAPQKDEEQWTVVRRRTKKKDTSKALASKPPRLQPTTAKASVRTPVTKLSVTAKPAVQEQKGNFTLSSVFFVSNWRLALLASYTK